LCRPLREKLAPTSSIEKVDGKGVEFPAVPTLADKGYTDKPAAAALQEIPPCDVDWKTPVVRNGNGEGGKTPVSRLFPYVSETSTQDVPCPGTGADFRA